MLERYGDIWEAVDEDYPDAVIITTNGYVKANGEAVMGRGIALEAKTRYPKLPADLGTMIKKYGNNVFAFKQIMGLWLITLPVKPERGPNGEMGWKAKADIGLIEDSVKQIVGAEPYYGLFNNLHDANEKLINRVFMPRPGCGNGKLKWEQVKPIIEPYLDDRFVVFHKD